MLIVRSLLFHTGFFLGTAIIGILFMPALAGPPSWARWVGSFWSRCVLTWVGWSAGLTWRLEGDLPAAPVIIAAKHQSAFETYMFPATRRELVFVLKHELLRVPLVGWFLARSGQIALDRKGGASAVRKLLQEAQQRLNDGLPLVIFPEGTRVPPGENRPLQPGVTALYRSLNVPVVPVTLDSGRYWPRNSFLRRPGTIRVIVQPTIPPGLDRRVFEARLNKALAEPTPN